MQVLDSLKNLSIIKSDAIMLEDEINGGISYKDFEIASGRLYNYLDSFKLNKEEIVAIRVKRSYRKAIAIFGALKAAIPFVVIADKSPTEYVNQVYEECKPVITIDDDFLDKGLKSEYLDGYKYRDNHDLAYVVYTTGSSGFFKGVMLEYGILEKRYNIATFGKQMSQETAKALEKMSFFLLQGFYGTAAIEDLINVIVYQSRMIIVDLDKADDIDYLINMANKKNVYTMSATPKTLPEFVNNPKSNFKEYIVNFEMFPSKYSEDYKLYDGYGLSEACGSLCFKEVDKDYEITPVGKPVPGMDVKLFDKNNKQTVTNQIGELSFVPEYFRGYIKRMDLFKKAYYDGYFHTGDLGYYNEEGDIVIIGRKKDILETKDGYVVPLFIANAIKKEFLDIEKCYVKIFKDENPAMVVAYYISNKEHNVEEINKKIASRIKQYAYITHAVKVDKINYFISGKINSNSFNKPTI